MKPKKRAFIALLLALGLFLSAFGQEEEEEYTRRSSRPGQGIKPTNVLFFVYVLDIDDIDGSAQNFQANIYIRLIWKDERLAHNDPDVRRMPLEEVWNPRILLANKQTMVRKSLPEVVKVQPDGTVTYHQRYVGPLSQPLRLSEFPFDKHIFTIQFVSVGHNPNHVRFVPLDVSSDGSLVGGGIQDKLSLPDWKVTNPVALARPYAVGYGIETAGFVFEFTARRYSIYYIWQVIVPLALIVMMSWAAFWIDPTHAGAQIGVATSSMLTMIAFRFMFGTLIPKLPYMTRLDYFTLGSTVLVFLTLVEVIATSILARNQKETLGRVMDKVARFVFPAVFAGWIYWSLIA